MNIIRNISKGLFGILLFASCQDSPFFSTYSSVDSEGWYTEDYLKFKLSDVTEDRPVSFTLGVRTTNAYEYDNVALKMRLYEQGRVVLTDTVFIDIFDTDGKNNGSGFPYVTTEKDSRKSYTLKKDSVYRVRLYHIMRLNPVKGITDAGITVK